MTKRLETFDFLRGIFIFFAFLQHYSFYMNHIWVGYYDRFYFGKLAGNIQAGLGPLPIDNILTWMVVFIVPWTIQVYLALATFNLGLNSHKLSKEKLASYNRKYLALFLYFTLEKFIIGRNIGEILSPNPLQIWMIALALLANGYFYFGVRVTSLFFVIAGTAQFYTPLNSWTRSFEEVLHNIHPEFSLEIRPDIFFLGALAGFLIGKYHHKIKDEFILLITVLSLFAIIGVNQFTPPFPYDVNNVFFDEYAWCYNIFGLASIVLTIILIISASLFLERKNFGVKLPGINQVGVHSLILFVFHRIFFIYLYLPVRLIAASLGIFPRIENTFWGNCIPILIYFGIFGIYRRLTYKKS
ncbi:MAG: hypothetical protein CME62_01120 [Halobacteriovoraceae bacterium]|nr:hypothetical protein [Halobacteriovoraceae bacterium]|tara:strand:- start:3039 stop:4106 length:1068 start_codon:yes stop_codon:yes gene_type:complete